MFQKYKGIRLGEKFKLSFYFIERFSRRRKQKAVEQ